MEGRLDRGHSGVLARVRSGRRSKFVDVLACVKYGFVVSAAQTPSSYFTHFGVKLPAPRFVNWRLGDSATTLTLMRHTMRR